MPIHRVRQGECAATLAAQHGFADWNVIWSHPDNANLREARKSPHVLLPGDVLAIPEKEPHEEEVETGGVRSFKVRLPRVHLRLFLKNRLGEPLKARAFELVVGEQTLSGTTDDTGLLEVLIPVSAKEATLRVALSGGRFREARLAVGHLDPEGAKEGYRHRLRNLGYLRGKDPSEADIAAALRAFQRDNDLEETGRADADTQRRLTEHHGA